ncbi:MAG: NAD(P)-dependent oxidoreductase [Acidimicrobiales bacterium]
MSADTESHDRPVIGLCGLGQMGLAVAERLASTFDVVAYDPDPDRRSLASWLAGVRPVQALHEISGLSTVVLSLPTPAISHSTCARLGELLSEGSLVIETSTVLPTDVIACAETLQMDGIELIDAAILSGVGQMQNAVATLLVGGDDAIVDRAMPVLDVLGHNVKRFGGLGTGMAAKVVNNGVAHAVMVVLIEGFAMAKASGVDPAEIADMLTAGDGGLIRPLTHRMMERVADAHYDGGMPLDAARKDSTLALAMAQASGVPLFATQAAQSVYDIAVARGLGRSDYAVIATLWEQWCGASLTMERPTAEDAR